MSAPRLEIRLDRIRRNTRTLVERLRPIGVSVSGVTKASLGDPEIAAAMLVGGASSLSDSRIENVERLRRSGITAEIALIRSPMMSQVDRVVAAADLSLNTELAVIEHLSAAARRQGRTHGIVVMVELGDLREGVLPKDLDEMVGQTLHLPNLTLRGIGTNLACQSGVIPSVENMEELADLATSVERTFGIDLDLVSGGNSANLGWALDPHRRAGRINHLRLGEAILLGSDPVTRQPINGLELDGFTLVGEVIEAKRKPMAARGTIGQGAFGVVERHAVRGGAQHRIIVALGRQDLDVATLVVAHPYRILGASSDHLVLSCGAKPPAIGSEIAFGLGYSGLLAAMTSPFVARRVDDQQDNDRLDTVVGAEGLEPPTC